MSVFDKPQSRAEAILQNILGANNTLGAPQSRIEVLLMMLIVIGYYVDGFCAQIACDVSTGKYKFRNKINGTWGEWTEDIFEGGGNNGD